MYYSSKAYVEQLPRGEAYPTLKPVYFIGVLNFKTRSNSNYLSRHLILDAVTHEQYFHDFEFCLIELPKFAKHESELISIVDKWIFFLKYLGSKGGEDKDFANIFADEPPLLQALEIARYHSLSRDELSVYEYQEKRRLIEAENAHTQRLLGHAEGRVEGRAEGREEGLQLAIKIMALARDGLSAEAIAQQLQIGITEVQKLL